MAAQQADLPGVQHLVLGTPQERLQLRRRKRVRVRHRLVERGKAYAERMHTKQRLVDDIVGIYRQLGG